MRPRLYGDDVCAPITLSVPAHIADAIRTLAAAKGQSPGQFLTPHLRIICNTLAAEPATPKDFEHG